MRTLLALLICLAVLQLNAATKKIYVADHTVACDNSSNLECYLVKYRAQDNWKTLHTYIDSFDYTEGYEYQLLVEVKKMEHPQPGQDSVEYVFRKLLTKTKTAYNPALKLQANRWYLSSLHADTTFINIMDTAAIYFDFSVAEQRIKSKLICNTGNGLLKATGYNISVTSLSTTKKGCTGNALEEIITGMLQEMSTFKVAGNTLTLYSTANTSMVFKRYVNIKTAD